MSKNRVSSSFLENNIGWSLEFEQKKKLVDVWYKLSFFWHLANKFNVLTYVKRNQGLFDKMNRYKMQMSKIFWIINLLENSEVSYKRKA